MINVVQNVQLMGAAIPHQPGPKFDKIILKSKRGLPENLDLSGCIAFTRDSNHKGWLHRLIFLIQRLLSCLYRKNLLFDYNLSHGFVILDKDINKKDHLIIAHSIMGRKANIRTASRNYLKEDDVTELVIYRPRSQNLREMIIKYGYQTSYTNPKFLPEQEREAAAKKGKGQFSILKMIGSVFVKQKLRDKADKRIAYLAADLLLGNQFKTVDGKKQEAMFCAPYTLAVLQTSFVIDSMTTDVRETLTNLKDRAKIAQAIFEKFKQKTEEGLSKAYWDNKVSRIKTTYAMSAHISEVLASESQEVNLQVQCE